MWLARLSFYLGTWVMIVVVYHDQLSSGTTGSVPKFESGPNKSKLKKLSRQLTQCGRLCTIDILRIRRVFLCQALSLSLVNSQLDYFLQENLIKSGTGGLFHDWRVCYNYNLPSACVWTPTLFSSNVLSDTEARDDEASQWAAFLFVCCLMKHSAVYRMLLLFVCSK